MGTTSNSVRANPYPEVTDPICRLPLPTLFYRLEADHLGDLMRFMVRLPIETRCPSYFQGPFQGYPLRTVRKTALCLLVFCISG
jgi:hypothetical protein